MSVISFLACGGALVGPVPDSGRADDYPEPLLASPAAEAVQWVDARGADAWAAGHLPGAVSAPAVELEPFDEDGGWTDQERSLLLAGFAARGLRQGIPIVVYTDVETGRASDGYLWATLRALGAGDVRLLDGGVAAWLLAGRELGFDTPPLGDFVGGEGVDLRVSTDEVAAAVEAGETRIVDVRSVEEFEAGHLPGAVSFPWDRVLDEGWMRPAEAVEAELAEVGLVDRDARVILYCAEGVRAGHTQFVLELMGFTAVRDYVGSYSAWVAAGLPVEGVD